MDGPIDVYNSGTGREELSRGFTKRGRNDGDGSWLPQWHLPVANLITDNMKI
jgi:hypothetical protein